MKSKEKVLKPSETKKKKLMMLLMKPLIMLREMNQRVNPNSVMSKTKKLKKRRMKRKKKKKRKRKKKNPLPKSDV
jgi:hypothetical protein